MNWTGSPWRWGGEGGKGRAWMELREFIAESIKQIAAGIRDAQDEVASGGGSLNPASAYQAGAPNTYVFDNEHSCFVQSVEFDVAVTVENETGKRAGIGVLTGIFSVGAATTSGASTSAMSRIRFAVPIRFAPGNKMPERKEPTGR